MKKIFTHIVAMMAVVWLSAASVAFAASKPVINQAYDVTNVTYVAWQYAQIPADNFLSAATSAEITLKGAIFVAFGYQKAAWNYVDYSDGVFNWNDANTAGVTYTISGDVLANAKNGGLYVRTNTASGLTMSIKNIGDGSAADESTNDDETGSTDVTVNDTAATDYTANLAEWGDRQIPGSAFNAKAESATIKIVGATYVRFSKIVNGSLQNLAGGEFAWNSANQAGVSITVTGDDLAAAAAANLYVYVGGGNPITITVTNSVNTASTGEPTVDEPTTGDDDTTSGEASTDEPTTDEPTVDEPTTGDDDTTSGETSTDEPTVDEPTTGEPSTGEPSTGDEPTVDEPSTDEPSTGNEPTVDDPKANEPASDDDTASTTTYGVTNTYATTLMEWCGTQIPGSAIDAAADKARIAVSGACYVKISDGSNIIKEFSWNDANKDGVKVELTDTELADAKAGYFYVWSGGGSPIEMTVTSFGEGGVAEVIPTRDITTLDMTKSSDRAYAIANRLQLTDVPTLYITVPDAEGQAINDVLYKDRTTNTAEYHDATIQVVDTLGNLEEFTDDVEIKVRGNSTADCVKKPYRLKFAKKHKHDLLGLGYDARNWTLLANYLDPSMIRNALTYHIGKATDMAFCPGYQFVDVVINDEYRGTYQISDQCEVGKKRINVDEDTGWYVEVSRADMIEEPCLYAAGLPMSIKNPEPDTDEEIAALKEEVSNWFTTMYNASFGTYNDAAFQDADTGWRAYWDEESLVNYYIAANITGDYDGFMTVKMYREADGKMYVGPLWDKDLAFGNYSADNGTTLIEDMNNGQFSYYFKKLTTDPVFIMNVHDKMQSIISDGIADNLQTIINQLEKNVSKTEPLNYLKWQSYSSWTQSFTTHAAAVQQVRDYLRNHITWFADQIDQKYEALGGSAISAKANAQATAVSNIGKAVESAAYAGNGQMTLHAVQPQTITVYSIAGTVVAKQQLDANLPVTISLPAGTYIVNNKKVVVK